MTDRTATLADFNAALSSATTEKGAFDALCALVKATVGAKLFTVMTADTHAMVARRAYTDDAEHYPTSGEKPIEPNRWFEQVLTRQEPFVSNTLADIDTVFPDAELIGKLGCGSVVNLPLILGGRVIATMNILHEEGYYTPARVALIHDHLRLPATAACAVAMVLRG
ncbi:GAF domain-containing protein [Salipiger sp. IMCC34102]|uniref:GAF domain-containing protein n=1 Tax=Salipiger sp. IMCC34102 TaxID=2510647 RepID=UPI00101B69CE|nr:GAF domain-containing protein [Salipiger sp. IMCC34102]RYH02598.1 GAF domain-containing protein [Salipiger sp. IMCC34102]